MIFMMMKTLFDIVINGRIHLSSEGMAKTVVIEFIRINRVNNESFIIRLITNQSQRFPFSRWDIKPMRGIINCKAKRILIYTAIKIIASMQPAIVKNFLLREMSHMKIATLSSRHPKHIGIFHELNTNRIMQNFTEKKIGNAINKRYLPNQSLSGIPSFF